MEECCSSRCTRLLSYIIQDYLSRDGPTCRDQHSPVTVMNQENVPQTCLLMEAAP